MTFQEHDLDLAVQAYVDLLKADFIKWGSNQPFNAVLKNGSKYIKVSIGGGAHSFIVKKNGEKFKVGDVLKAASWAAPATNFARGNVITQKYAGLSWAGL